MNSTSLPEHWTTLVAVGLALAAIIVAIVQSLREPHQFVTPVNQFHAGAASKSNQRCIFTLSLSANIMETRLLSVYATWDAPELVSWVKYLTQSGDIFHQMYAGYWLRGIEHDSARGWLCWENDEKSRMGEEPDREAAKAAWAAERPLPAGWHRLNKVMAVQAWIEGIKRWGVDWYKHSDANCEDYVVQLALLGENRYG